MSLPYENATSGQNAVRDIQKVLMKFGCTKFATGQDFETGELFVQFEHRGRLAHVKASAKGYAAAWLKEHPYNPMRHHHSRDEHERRALHKGDIAVYSVLRDWIKGQITAVEIGMMTFEAAFLSHLMLPSGLSVIEHVQKHRMLAAPDRAEGSA